MIITYQLLEEYGACEQGKEWIKKHYPDGAELSTLMTQRHFPKSFLHWGYKYLSTSEEEKALYHKILGNSNNNTILECSNTTNSTRVFYSNNVDNGVDIHRCEDVKHSQVVINSNNIENSDQIFLSEFIYDSKKILNSANINQSINIIESTYVVRSKNIYMSNLITGCGEIYKSINLEDSFLCNNCSNLKHCFGCQNLHNEEYCIFNVKIGKEHFEIIKKQYLSIMETLFAYVDSWPTDLINIEIPKINRKFPQHYQTIPPKFWKWIKTLPNYSDNHMFYLTSLPEFLTK